jgi:hypothetical protein
MKLNHKFWVEIVATTTYIQNQILTNAISNMTPKEVWCGYKPSISHFGVFGCVAFAHVPKEVRTKLDSKGVKCIFVTYCEEIKGYKLSNPISQYVIINHDVIFNEFQKL